MGDKEKPHYAWIKKEVKKEDELKPPKEKKKKKKSKKTGDDDASGSAEGDSKYWSKGMEYYLYIRYKYTHNKKGKPYHKGDDYKALAKMCVSSWSPTRFWKALVGEDPPQSYVTESDAKSDDKKDKK